MIAAGNIVPSVPNHQRGTVGQSDITGRVAGEPIGTKALALKSLQTRRARQSRAGQAVNAVPPAQDSVKSAWDKNGEALSQPYPKLSQESGTALTIERVYVSGIVPLSQTLGTGQLGQLGQIACLGCGKPFTPSDENKVYCRAKCANTMSGVLR